jgi:two-component system KDP operon response regulator KdpE
MKTKILLVQDSGDSGDSRPTRVLNGLLAHDGYDLRSVPVGHTAMTAFVTWQPAVVITDLAAGRADGLEFCRRIRATSRTPVIVVSPDRDEASKVAAFDAGSDDYVTRPFGSDELLARVRAVLRRARTSPETSSTIVAGAFRIDLDSRRVHHKGSALRLTPKEFELLLFMARHPNRVLGHRTLLGAVWGAASEEESAYLRVFVGRLRKRFEADPSHPEYFVTEPWVGYRFNPDGSTSSFASTLRGIVPEGPGRIDAGVAAG